MSGRLFIVATPIGNLGDLSARARQVLTDASLILAEDTRVSIKLLHHLGVKTPLVSCHQFNEQKRLSVLIAAQANDQDVALISDAGTPLVSDPGYQLVRKAIELGMDVVPVPGPAAVITALVGSGLPPDRFAFEGFLPDKSGDRRRRLDKIKDDDRTLIFYAAPSNVVALLKDMLDIFGDRPACLARELTKLHEQFIRKSLRELTDEIANQLPRGEFVLVVGGSAADMDRRLPEEIVYHRLAELLSAGGRLKEVASLLARESGWSSSQLYKIGLSIQQDETAAEGEEGESFM